MAAGDDKSGLNIDERRRIVHEQIANYQKVINDLEKDRLKNGTDMFGTVLMVLHKPCSCLRTGSFLY